MSTTIKSLQSLVTPSKTVKVAYPGMDGFTLDITFLSRDELLKMRKKCITTSFDRKSHVPVDKLDDELFVKNYTNSVIKGWSGLKLSFLEQLMLVELGDANKDSELEYSEENALLLMKNSTELDSFVSDVTSDLTNFTKFSTKN